MSATRPLAALAIVAMLAPTATSQTTSGADRYMGSAQASLGRTNGVIASIAPNTVSRGAGGGSAMIGAAQQSFDRTNAAMRSMLANREAAVRGLGQAAVYRTSDNLYGVYWQNYYLRRAQMFSTYSATGRANAAGTTPLAAVRQMQLEDNARRRLQQRARGQQIIRRQDRLTPELPPNPGIFTQDTILNDVPGADLIRRDAERAAQDAPPPFMTPIPAVTRAPLPRD